MTELPVDSLTDAVRSGDRRALARAITLVESTRADHREQAAILLDRLMPYCRPSIRLGISGVPGAGKSTLIEKFGPLLLAAGHRLAVLAVDPSSPRSGGSLLGDKTRMEALAREPDVFIRPTPAAGSLGGVARRTREVMLLCEAAGFDLLLIETVGVGQSEMAVAELVDMFLLLLVPGGGDELQGLKKGIVEMADAIIINKADGELRPAAERAAQDYRNALHLLRPWRQDWVVPVLQCSAQTGEGLDQLWQMIGQFCRQQQENGGWQARRSQQALGWLWQEVSEELLDRLKRDPKTSAARGQVEAEVSAGRMRPGAAAALLLKGFLDRGV